MAKTRIKTTPTRMQKEALMASAAVTTTTTNIVAEHVFKKRISVLKNPITAKEKPLPMQSTIIVQPPRRTNSISSTTSTISHTSEGTRSCTDSPPPPLSISETNSQNNGPTMDELTESAIKTLNAGLMAKSNARALKNRKVYMITEKCDDAANTMNNTESGNWSTNGTGTGQKRKMYLIMEEKEGDKNYGDHAEKQMKAENKKLTLFTDTSNGQLPQEFEKILPEILNCIQAKKGAANSPVAATNTNESCDINVAAEPKAQISLLKTNNNLIKQKKTEIPERLPLTLPPKKNRTKIITTQIIPVNPSQHAIYPSNGLENWSAATSGVVVSNVTPPALVTTGNGFYKTDKACGATPVIVNASTLTSTNGNGAIPSNGFKSKENNNSNKTNNANQMHKNINLSTDFLFLMKMLPKLESIEEPHKTYVKTCIENIINQYAPNQIEEQ